MAFWLKKRVFIVNKIAMGIRIANGPKTFGLQLGPEFGPFSVLLVIDKSPSILFIKMDLR